MNETLCKLLTAAADEAAPIPATAPSESHAMGEIWLFSDRAVRVRREGDLWVVSRGDATCPQWVGVLGVSDHQAALRAAAVLVGDVK